MNTESRLPRQRRSQVSNALIFHDDDVSPIKDWDQLPHGSWQTFYTEPRTKKAASWWHGLLDLALILAILWFLAR